MYFIFRVEDQAIFLLWILLASLYSDKFLLDLFFISKRIFRTVFTSKLPEFQRHLHYTEVRSPTGERGHPSRTDDSDLPLLLFFFFLLPILYSTSTSHPEKSRFMEKEITALFTTMSCMGSPVVVPADFSFWPVEPLPLSALRAVLADPFDCISQYSLVCCSHITEF